MREPKPGLERAQQRVRRSWPGQAVVAPAVAGDDEERDAAAVDAGKAASRAVVVALVPDDEDHAAVAVGARVHDPRDPAGEPPVAGADRAVVHVVGVVRDDVAQRRRAAQAARKRAQLPQVAALARPSRSRSGSRRTGCGGGCSAPGPRPRSRGGAAPRRSPAIQDRVPVSWRASVGPRKPPLQRSLEQPCVEPEIIAR